MSLSKSKCWYTNNCLHFLKCAVPLKHRLSDCLHNCLFWLFLLNFYPAFAMFWNLGSKWDFSLSKQSPNLLLSKSTLKVQIYKRQLLQKVINMIQEIKWKIQCIGTLKLRTVYSLVSSFELLYHSPSENHYYLNFLNTSLLAMQSGMRHTTKRDLISILIDESY